MPGCPLRGFVLLPAAQQAARGDELLPHVRRWEPGQNKSAVAFGSTGGTSERRLTSETTKPQRCSSSALVSVRVRANVNALNTERWHGEATSSARAVRVWALDVSCPALLTCTSDGSRVKRAARLSPSRAPAPSLPLPGTLSGHKHR